MVRRAVRADRIVAHRSDHVDFVMTKQLFSLFLALSASTALAGALPAPVNLDFRQGDADGKPAGWTPFAANDDVRRECAATCALHVRGGEGGAPEGVYQLLAPAGAAGHRLILSGRIRTDKAEGNAFLVGGIVMQPGQAPVSQFVAGRKPPNGTTDWQRFEVAVPVPGNAFQVAIAAGLNGKGEAWMDSLELKVDESVTVADFVPPAPVPLPPRPVPSQQLLDDDALRIPDADIPAIAPAWRDDVRARRHAIRSLFSDDFSDLQFLKPLLKGKRIVQLGEPAHGVAETNWAKVRLIRFLHQEMGFDVVAFESSFDQCHEADKRVGTLATPELMGRCIFWAWHTKEVQGLFDYMAAQRNGARPLHIAGFDIQFTTMEFDNSRARNMLAVSDAALATRLDEQDQALRNARDLSAQRSAAFQAFYAEVAKVLASHRTALRAAGHGDTDIDVAIQAAHGRAWLARKLEHEGRPDATSGMSIRDAGMAEQFGFLLDHVYPNRKVVVWAHNEHVTYAQPAGRFTSMGEVLAHRRRAQMYTVGLYVGRGVINNGYEPSWPVAAPPPDTVEGVLANGGLKYAFVDFSTAASRPATRWFTDTNRVREFGTNVREIVPARSYDAIFYIDTATPARKIWDIVEKDNP
jgi:erythromycin esterase